MKRTKYLTTMFFVFGLVIMAAVQPSLAGPVRPPESEWLPPYLEIDVTVNVTISSMDTFHVTSLLGPEVDSAIFKLHFDTKTPNAAIHLMHGSRICASENNTESGWRMDHDVSSYKTTSIQDYYSDENVNIVDDILNAKVDSNDKYESYETVGESRIDFKSYQTAVTDTKEWGFFDVTSDFNASLYTEVTSLLRLDNESLINVLDMDNADAVIDIDPEEPDEGDFIGRRITRKPKIGSMFVRSGAKAFNVFKPFKSLWDKKGYEKNPPKRMRVPFTSKLRSTGNKITTGKVESSSQLESVQSSIRDNAPMIALIGGFTILAGVTGIFVIMRWRTGKWPMFG